MQKKEDRFYELMMICYQGVYKVITWIKTAFVHIISNIPYYSEPRTSPSLGKQQNPIKKRLL